MRKVTLNGKKMTSKERAHRYIKWKLRAPGYYGKNLDALWDVLSTYDKPIEILVTNGDSMVDNLEDYGASIIEIFHDAEKENNNIKVEIVQ